MAAPNKIVLVGMPGSGKSSTGKLLAGKLQYLFIDLDKAIVEEAGAGIVDIFKTGGESAFRTLEQQVLKKVLDNKDPMVLACGGGTPCFFDNMEVINQHGTSYYLQAPPALLAQRLQHAKAERPLLKDKSEEELQTYLEETLQERAAYYTKAHHTISVLAITPGKLLELFGLY